MKVDDPHPHAFTTISGFDDALDGLCKQAAPQRKPSLELNTQKKTKRAGKGKPGNANGAAAKAKGAHKATTKRLMTLGEIEANLLAKCNPGREDYARLEARSEWEQKSKKRAYSNAYNRACKAAKNDGKDDDAAKQIGKNAGIVARLDWVAKHIKRRPWNPTVGL